MYKPFLLNFNHIFKLKKSRNRKKKDFVDFTFHPPPVLYILFYHIRCCLRK